MGPHILLFRHNNSCTLASALIIAPHACLPLHSFAFSFPYSLTNLSDVRLRANVSSLESTQGYQDSDDSPLHKIMLSKRKRKLSLSTIQQRGKKRQRYTRRRSYPNIANDASSESSNLSFTIPRKMNTKSLLTSDNSSLNTEVYRSDSYQLLMPKEKRNIKLLDKIDENSPMYNDVDMSEKYSHLQVIVDNEIYDLQKESSPTANDGHTDAQNSSNVSLPLSPELSVVERISVSKELLSSVEDHPTINEVQANDITDGVYNKYLISELDVSMPLMGQDCEIKKSVTPKQDSSMKSMEPKSLSKMDYVNITETASMSETLNAKLRNLLLESAKKAEVDMPRGNATLSTGIQKEKKTKAQKRCSTPHKKGSKQKSKTPSVEPVVEEERIEYCSKGGRKSCPPAMPSIRISTNDTEVNLIGKEPAKTKGKKKKDIIKVKILKPQNKNAKKTKKSATQSVSEKVSTDFCSASVHTDSGINETSSLLCLHDADDSVDLIHNHSETCLQTQECCDDSVEFVAPTPKSTISLSSNSSSFVDSYINGTQYIDTENIPPEVFCCNALDGINVTCGK